MSITTPPEIAELRHRLQQQVAVAVLLLRGEPITRDAVETVLDELAAAATAADLGGDEPGMALGAPPRGLESLSDAETGADSLNSKSATEGPFMARHRTPTGYAA